MRKAILYVRVSTDEQAEKGHSLGHQEDRLRQYCLQNNIEIVAFYKEDHSAKTFERPEFKKLLAFIKSNKNVADILLFLKWDRFSRNAADAYAMISQLNRLGVEPQAMEQPLNLEIPEHKFMLAIYLAAPEVENDRRALNIISGMRKAMKEGRWMGSPPKGYKRSVDENLKPCIIPNKDVELVNWIFQQMATGLYHIEELRRMVHKKGMKISHNSFWWMLRNPVYIGKLIVPAYKDERSMIVPAKHEPIVPEKLFYEVQDVLDGKKRKDLPAHYNKQNELPLRGFLKCNQCGHNLTGSASKGRYQRYFYYHCKYPCKERLPASEPNDAFDEYLISLSGNKKLMRVFDHIWEGPHKKQGREKADELAKLKQELETCKKRLSNAQLLMLDGHLDTNEYRNIKNQLEPEIGRLTRQIVDYQEKDPEEADIKQFGFMFLNRLGELFEVATPEDKHLILGSTFPEKLVCKDGKVRTASGSDIQQLLFSSDTDFRETKKGQSNDFDCPSCQVELGRVELPSKHIRRKLSTCLLLHYLSGYHRGSTNQ